MRFLDNFNEKESSVSSNFSMFQPNEELKSFYQNELWNNKSFQMQMNNKFKKEGESDDDEDFEEEDFDLEILEQRMEVEG